MIVPLALVSLWMFGPGFIVGLLLIVAGVQVWRHGDKLKRDRLAREALQKPTLAEREAKFHRTIRDDWEARRDARMR